MSSGNSILFSTEFVALLLGTLVHFFIRSNKPRHTTQFTVNFLGITFLQGRLLTEVILQAYVGVAPVISNAVVNVLIVLFWIFHLATLTCIFIYIYRLSNIELDVKIINIVITVVYSLCLVIGFILMVKGRLYYNDGSTFVLLFSISYIEGISAVSTIIFFIRTILNYKHFPRPIFRYIVFFVPIIAMLQITQALNFKQIFSGIVYMIPYVVLYFMYHNDSHNSSTGVREEISLEGYLENLIKSKSSYYLIVIKSVVSGVVDQDNFQTYMKKLWSFARDCEYLDRNVCIFRLDNNAAAILITTKNESKREKTRDGVRDLATALFDSFSDVAIGKAYEFRDDEHITSVGMGKTFAHYVTEKVNSAQVQSCWIQIMPEEYEQYAYRYEIEKALKNIYERADLEDERVICFAQPIYHVPSQDFKTAEALMRFKLNGQMIPPSDVIPIAEDINCIHIITKIMLNKTCKFLAEYKDKYDIESISVNCSMKELLFPNVYEEFVKIIRDNGVDPEMIRLEVTESATAENREDYEMVKRNLRLLYNEGIRFYLDDYGTGYSNLARLISLRMSIIKLDKSMLYKAMDDRAMEQIVSTIVEVFSQKGTKILVEGVENDEQDAFAKAHGIEYIQGFRYAAPVHIEEIVDYYKRK